MKKLHLIAFTILSLFSFPMQAQKLLPAEQEIELQYGADRLGKRYDAAMQKFRENRLGAFIHWGIVRHSRRRMGTVRYITGLPNGSSHGQKSPLKNGCNL